MFCVRVYVLCHWFLGAFVAWVTFPLPQMSDALLPLENELAYHELVLPSADLHGGWYEYSLGNVDRGEEGQLPQSHPTALTCTSGCYTFKCGPEDRFIIWRFDANLLELIEYSLNSTLKGNAIRLNFEYNIVPDVMFHEVVDSPDKSVLVVIVTTRSLGRINLRRLVFSHPICVSGLHGGDESVSYSIFYHSSKDVRMIEESNNFDIALHGGSPDVPVLCSAFDEQRVLVGCFSGSIIMIKLGELYSSAPHTEVILGISGFGLDSVLGFLPFFSKKKASVAGLAVHRWQEDNFVFSLTVDGKLCVWKLESRNLKSIQVEAVGGGLDDSCTGFSMRFIPPLSDRSESDTFKLVVLECLKNEAYLHVFKGKYTAKTHSVNLIPSSVNHCDQGDLVIDFGVSRICPTSPNKQTELLWVLSQGMNEREQDYVLKYLLIEQNLQRITDFWCEASLDSPFHGLGSFITDRFDEVYMDTMLEPGRFDPSTVWKALYYFTEGQMQVKPIVTAGPSGLRQALFDEIRLYAMNMTKQAESLVPKDPFSAQLPGNNTVPGQTAPSEEKDDATFQKALRSAWMKFVEVFLQVWRKDHECLRLVHIPIHGGLMVLIKREFVSFVLKMSVLEGIVSSPRLENTNISHSVLERQFFKIEKRTGLRDLPRQIYQLVQILDDLALELGHEVFLNFDRSLFQLMDPIHAVMSDIEELLGGLLELRAAPNSTTRQTRRTFLRVLSQRLQAISDPVRLVSLMLEILRATEVVDLNKLLSSRENESTFLHHSSWDHHPQQKTVFQSSLMMHVFWWEYKHRVHTNYDLVRNCLYLLILITQQPSLKILPGQTEVQEVIATLSSLVKKYYLLKWTSTHFTAPVTQEIFGTLLQGSAVQSYPSFGPIFDRLNYHQTARHRHPSNLFELVYYELVEPLLHWNVQTVEDNSPNLSGLAIHPAIQTVTSLLIELLCTSSQRGKNLAPLLLSQRQSLILNEYLRLLRNKSAYCLYLMGQCHLEMGQDAKAMNLFIEAATKLKTLGEEELLCEYIDLIIGRGKSSGESNTLRYWLFLLQMLEDRQNFHMGIKLATIAQQDASSDESKAFLYCCAFKYALSVGHYEHAYLSMISNPIEDRRLSCLKRLLLAMIKEDKLKKMVSYPFVDLIYHVHDILIREARESDLYQNPNYYHVLYAFHVSKSNYQEAANTMCQYANRLMRVQLRPLDLERYSSALLMILYVAKLMRHSHVPLAISDGQDEETASIQYCTLEQLEKHYWLIHYNRKLIERTPLSEAYNKAYKPPEKILKLLAQEEMFDHAYSFASIFGLPMTEIFSRHTLYCLKQQCSIDTPRLELWNPLKTHLFQYDTPETGFQYHTTVASTILDTDRRIQLPLWLILSFKGELTGSSEPSQRVQDKSFLLLSIYLKYDLLFDAGQLILYMVKHASDAFSRDTNPHFMLHYHLIDQYLSRIKEIFTSPDYATYKPTDLSCDLAASIEQQIIRHLNDYFEIVHSKTNSVPNEPLEPLEPSNTT
ncbi:nuclear pore complex protein Nup160-like [Schistocerca gregaria]|uniref:nuclear pore complex protein Nup160-like n=1 Tax=Schistocerca gregaria TaxID=7010 RepID=UPI00211E2D66|nr:nuclear pore complex protein Nup160-like [Schistocerca gregaria]